MRKLIAVLLMAAALVTTSFAGSAVVIEKNKASSSSDSFYRDQEFNLGVFGSRQVTNGDRWGGGLDAKYFFARNFGLGLELSTLTFDKLDASALVTGTVRVPLANSRFAPYGYVGGGVVGIKDNVRAAGKIGAGLEYRLAPNVGLITDYSWNIVEKSGNDFGTIRAGVNFAF